MRRSKKIRNNLWILTEERPKLSVIEQILNILKKDKKYCIKFSSPIKICPIIKKQKFQFEYQVKKVSSPQFKNVYISIVSGSSSFIDYLVICQKDKPKEPQGLVDKNNLLIAVEETKTSDQDSRNTGVYQRGTKFVYAKKYYPNVQLYMLYNDEMKKSGNKAPSATSIFGTNMLLTIGVSIIGKNMRWFHKFNTIQELIDAKKKMKNPPKQNVPIKIKQQNDKIFISGRLAKPSNAHNIGHDPNIGAISLICQSLRDLGWTKNIIITNHEVDQAFVDKNRNNKFLYVCDLLNIQLENLTIHRSNNKKKYWHYEVSSEKVASILLHSLCENEDMHHIYENHAGCERGYFIDHLNNYLALPKKDANNNIISIPDLIIADDANKDIFIIEGKKYSTLKDGLKQLNNYNIIEKDYVNKFYAGYKTYRYLSIFGGDLTNLPDKQVMFYLNNDGLMIFNSCLPQTFKKKFNKFLFD